MAAFTATCRCCSERLFTANLDAAWSHTERHSENGHDAVFRRTARTRARSVTVRAPSEPPRPEDSVTRAD